MKKTKKICANLFLDSAEILGIESEIISEKKGLILLKNQGKEVYIQNNFLGVNFFTSYLIAKSKYISHKILSKDSQIPLPKMFLFSLHGQSSFDIVKSVSNLKQEFKKIVIKPNNLSLGVGVFVDPKNDNEISDAVEKIVELGVDSLLVESLIEGDDYRIILFDGECIGMVKRLHANVVGDGESSVEKLIKEKNIHRQEIGFKTIKIDKDLKSFLKEQNIDLNYIPKLQEKIKLRKVCNFSQGGETENVDIKTLHPEYFKIFKSITKLSQLRLIGIDLISKNISKSPFETGSAINEINAHPQLDVNQYADVCDNNAYNTINTVLKKVFELD